MIGNYANNLGAFHDGGENLNHPYGARERIDFLWRDTISPQKIN